MRVSLVIVPSSNQPRLTSASLTFHAPPGGLGQQPTSLSFRLCRLCMLMLSPIPHSLRNLLEYLRSCFYWPCWVTIGVVSLEVARLLWPHRVRLHHGVHQAGAYGAPFLTLDSRALEAECHSVLPLTTPVAYCRLVSTVPSVLLFKSHSEGQQYVLALLEGIVSTLWSPSNISCLQRCLRPLRARKQCRRKWCSSMRVRYVGGCWDELAG